MKFILLSVAIAALFAITAASTTLAGRKQQGTRTCWTCGPGYVHWYDIAGMPEPADKCACVPDQNARNCWTCPAGQVHWYDVEGMEEPADKCACVLDQNARNCWTCPAGYVHWYDIEGMEEPADKCACVPTSTTGAPTTETTTTTTTTGTPTTTTTRAPTATTRAPTTTTRRPTTTTTRRPTTTTTRRPTTTTTRAPATTTRAPATTTTRAPTTTTTRAPTTTTTRAPTTTTRAPVTSAPSGNENYIAFTPEMQQRMVDLHNQARAAVNPPAKTMPQVTWDPIIAQFALNYTLQCSGSGMVGHNPVRRLPVTNEYVGENIWASTQSLTGADALKLIQSSVSSWVSEDQYFNYASNTCQSGQACGHYTQVVWANSVRIGCALVRCSNLRFGTTILCNYGPGGNMMGQKPYVAA